MRVNGSPRLHQTPKPPTGGFFVAERLVWLGLNGVCFLNRQQ